ncbi:unnamed protein product [Protopolystoma xenopodis]|uniref:Uncharacterized protein n=1 Tax=Protopolystoma xenopodis TaxID=117903 RepID=A0A3S5FGZ5_9PLAT|nr:unnamed protein product [Protopolystoma xenopodis]
MAYSSPSRHSRLICEPRPMTPAHLAAESGSDGITPVAVRVDSDLVRVPSSSRLCSRLGAAHDLAATVARRREGLASLSASAPTNRTRVGPFMEAAIRRAGMNVYSFRSHHFGALHRLAATLRPVHCSPTDSCKSFVHRAQFSFAVAVALVFVAAFTFVVASVLSVDFALAFALAIAVAHAFFITFTPARVMASRLSPSRWHQRLLSSLTLSGGRLRLGVLWASVKWETICPISTEAFETGTASAPFGAGRSRLGAKRCKAVQSGARRTDKRASPDAIDYVMYKCRQTQLNDDGKPRFQHTRTL